MNQTGSSGRRNAAIVGRWVAACLLAAAAAACGMSDSPGARSESSGGAVSDAGTNGRFFSDVAGEVGLDFVHYNGMSGHRYFVEMVGAGGALLDYDGDGDLDVYLVQGHGLRGPAGGPEEEGDPRPVDRLFRNDLRILPDGARALRFTDVTEESGIEATGYGMGATTGDYDNDGWVDLYVINWGSNQLWRNNGDGTFTDVTTESGTDDPRWSTGAAFVDIDLDGWLDLIIVNYNRYTWESEHPCYAESGRRDYCGPQSYPPEQDRLLRNRGDGTFEDVTLRMGISEAFGPALGVVTADFNLDGWPDIYVADDQDENQLWMNRQGRRFENEAAIAGAAVNVAGAAEASMGVNAVDFDADGDEDIFLTHLTGETNTLYVNVGDGLFEDRTRVSGLGVASRLYTGFGVAPLDFDNDGWLDLFIANGAVRIIPEQADRGEALPLKQTNQLFRNLGEGRFREVTPSSDGVFDVPEVGRGVAYGDVDNDGDTDILLTSNNAAARLLRNEVGQENAWLGLRLLRAPGGRDMLGARVAVVRTGRPTLWRRVHVDGSYASASDPRVLVGLGSEGAYDSVRVHWPGGGVEVWDDLAINRYHRLARGEGRAVEAR